MEVEARGVEGPIVIVSISGFEVAVGIELGGVPEAAAEIGKEREVGPELRYLANKDGILVYGSQGIVEIVVAPLNCPSSSVYAQLRRRFTDSVLHEWPLLCCTVDVGWL